MSLIGRHDRAIAESERARALDPLSSIINSWLGSRYYFAGHYDKAIEQYRNTLEMDPDFVPGHLVLGQAYEQKGMLKEAVAELEKAVSLSGSSAVCVASLARAYAVAGRKTPALKLLGDLKKLRNQRYVSSYDMALAVSGLGDKGEALAWLQRAVEERSPRVLFLKIEPRLNFLRSDSGLPGSGTPRRPFTVSCGSFSGEIRSLRSRLRNGALCLRAVTEPRPEGAVTRTGFAPRIVKHLNGAHQTGVH